MFIKSRWKLGALIFVSGAALILYAYQFVSFGNEEGRKATLQVGSFLPFRKDQIYMAPNERFLVKMSIDDSCKYAKSDPGFDCITFGIAATSEGVFQPVEIAFPVGERFEAFWTVDSAICIVMFETETIYLVENKGMTEGGRKNIYFNKRLVNVDQLSDPVREFLRTRGI
jgi:hypothetical protein